MTPPNSTRNSEYCNSEDLNTEKSKTKFIGILPKTIQMAFKIQTNPQLEGFKPFENCLVYASEIRTCPDFEWSKTGWLPNDLDFEWS